VATPRALNPDGPHRACYAGLDGPVGAEVTIRVKAGYVEGRLTAYGTEPRAEPPVDAMSIPASSEATELINLAERMGIPTQDAIHQVLTHLTHEQQLNEVTEAVRSLTRKRPAPGAKGTGTPTPGPHRHFRAS
jgi:hypothetical protein